MTLFIFESHPVQYHAPVYRELHRICGGTGVPASQGKVRVFYASDVSLRGHLDPGFGERVAWDEPLLEGYDATVLNNENGTPLDGFHSLTGKGVCSLLRRERPDAVLLTGLAYRFDWSAFVAARGLGIPIWMRTETQDQAFSRGEAKDVLRELTYRTIYRQIDRALAIGALNAEHYRRHGLPPARIGFSPYCVPDRFAALSAEAKDRMRAELRERLGFREGQTVLLFCGKLQHKKNPALLLQALAEMSPEERRGYAVLYVGSGELQAELQLAAAVAQASSLLVHFAGFKNQTELAAYYLASDILVLPSRQMGETWGLVVNEALLAERRVIVSRHCGCHADFAALPSVRVFDGSLAGLLDCLRNMPGPESVLGQRDFMRRYSVRAAAEGIAEAMGVVAPA